ncbi:MAG: class II glutamine amidotransferase [Imperialibacter sp.]|uniref:class II glutamine amidotransferase n=1 Tax=Imperialibacter sp. TaxID=2038411 RepID=UPI0032ED09D3
MCRLLAYLGRPILMDKFLYEPKNSMIKQSFSAKEIEEPLNGDGFGVGWYHKEISPDPATFVSIYPAWNNRNLRYLAPKVKSECLVAHVRAASEGDVSEANCHPFHYQNYLMLHNGGVDDFIKIKRRLTTSLHEDRYRWIKGQTDSEHLFAVFLDKLATRGTSFDAEDVADSFEEMIVDMKAAMHEAEITDPAYLNMVFVDGERMVGLRYISNPSDKPLTLYYSEGSRYVCEDGMCHMLPATPEEKSVMIVSEKLTEFAEDWKPIPDNHMILVKKDLSVSLRKVTA